MFNRSQIIFALLLVSAMTTGCSGTQKKIGDAVLPKHDEVLIYNLPYDLTYLKTLEAVQTLPDWELESTEKENGIVRVYNHSYMTISDADKRRISFFIKRVSRNQTSIEIAPDDQTVIGGDDLLKVISQKLSKQL